MGHGSPTHVSIVCQAHLGYRPRPAEPGHSHHRRAEAARCGRGLFRRASPATRRWGAPERALLPVGV